MKKKTILATLFLAILILSSCTAPASKDSTPSETSPSPAAETSEINSEQETKSTQETVSSEAPKGVELTLYTDQNGDTAYIPADFNVSENRMSRRSGPDLS